MTASRPTPMRSIWFDCDSTLSMIEGIDALAALRDAATLADVAELTRRAMDGELPLEAVYGARLARIAPTRQECERTAQAYIDHMVTDAPLVIAALAHLGKQLGIVSGGLLPAVGPLAAHLGIPRDRVFAVDLRFDSCGAYRDFEADSPLAKAGGKIDVLAARPARDRPQALVGDGSTDLEAAAVVDRFVGFGGVVRRRALVEGAAHFAVGPGLATALPFVLTDAERAALRTHPRFAALGLE